MPMKPGRACQEPGCTNIIIGNGYHCEEHSNQYERDRLSSHQRGYDTTWHKARLQYLRRYPLCRHCEDEGKLTSATEVDHIIPHKGDTALFWDSKNNWQSLCKTHHSIKTNEEMGRVAR